MTDTIKINNLIENMTELEVEEPEQQEEPDVKAKRRYRSKFHDMTEEQIKQHKAEVKRKSNLKYRLNHYDKIREVQKKYSSSEKGLNYQRDYKRKEALLKKEAKLQEPLNI
jgi:hypothetical protein